MSKRRRTGVGFRVAATRPIDKSLIFVAKTAVASTQQETALITATTACTVVGLRWSIMFEGDAGTETNPHDYVWGIILVLDGDSVNNAAQADAGAFFEPEQNLLVFGVGSSRMDASGSTSQVAEQNNRWDGHTKTMRKLRIGDRLLFFVKGIATETVRCRGVVQLFCKS